METPPGESPVSGDALLPRLRSLPARLIDQHNRAVSAQQIDQYLDALEEPKRTTLAQLRQMILDILPEAGQGISYGVPAFKVRGKTIAGFAAFKNHMSYLPHSGSVFPQLTEELTGYPTSSGALRFSIDQPLPRSLVEKLIAVRLRQAFPALGIAPGPLPEAANPPALPPAAATYPDGSAEWCGRTGAVPGGRPCRWRLAGRRRALYPARPGPPAASLAWRQQAAGVPPAWSGPDHDMPASDHGA